MRSCRAKPTSNVRLVCWWPIDSHTGVTGRVPMRLLWAAGLVSLAVGVVRAWAPSTDFSRVMHWSAQVLAGQSPYVPGEPTDYPPWALVTLAPWAALPESWQLPLWVVLNSALAIWLVSSLSREGAPDRRTDAAVAALLLCASCFRVLNQFSLVSMALAWVGVRHPSPAVGGVWLGLALMKPQIGGVFWVAHLLMRDWRRVVVAMSVPALLTCVAAAWLGQSPVGLSVDAARQLAYTQGTLGSPPGNTELRAWLVPLSPSVMSLAAAAGLAVLLMLPALRRSWREAAQNDAPRRLALYGFCGAVSLLSVRHLAYDFLLLLPVLVAWRARPTWFWALWVPLVIQLPGWWRQVLGPLGAPEFLSVLTEADRLLAVVVWGLLARSSK